MADEIIQNYQHKYESVFHHLLQQKEMRLRNYVTVKPNCAGKLMHFDRYGLLTFVQKTARNIGNTQQTNYDAPTSKRVMAPVFFRRAIGFDEFDATQLAAADVPLTETVQAFGYAAARKMDEIIFRGVGGDGGMLGNAYEADDGYAGTAIPLPATQEVANTVGADTGMSLAKLRAGLQLMMEAEAWGQDSESNGDVCCVAMRAAQIVQLLADPELTTYDQHEIRKLLGGGAGFIDIYGIRIVRSEQLGETGGTVNCPMWVKSRVFFGLWVDHRVKLSIRDDSEEAIQLAAKFGCGAIRMEEKGVVNIHADITAAANP